MATPEGWFGGWVVPADVYQNGIWQCLEVSPLKLQYDDDVHNGYLLDADATYVIRS